MEKNFYFVCVKEFSNGKYAAYVETLLKYDNIAYVVKDRGYSEMYSCSTKKEAEKIAEEANQQYTSEGKYYYKEEN